MSQTSWIPVDESTIANAWVPVKETKPAPEEARMDLLMKQAQAEAGVSPPGPILPKPQFGTDPLSGVAGAVRGAGEGVGVQPDTAHPFKNAVQALNEQVNKAATTPWAQGGPLYGVISMMGRGAVETGKAVGGGAKTMIEGAEENNVEKFYEGAGRGIASALVLKGLFKPAVEGYQGTPEAAPVTMGMAKGGATAQVEKILNRIPITSDPLKKVYGKIADSFTQMTSDAVEKEAGIKGNPSNIVGTLNQGSRAVKAAAKDLYNPVDEYIETTGRKPLLNAALKQIGADPDIARELPTDFYDHPINGIKIMQRLLERKINTLSNTGRGLEANNYILQAQGLDTLLESVKSALPDALKQSLNMADKKWAQGSAMSDMADFFRSHAEGVPISEQEIGTTSQKMTFKGQKISEELSTTTDKGANLRRLSQALGPDAAKAIAQRASTLGKAQELGGTGITGSGLFGTGILMRAMGGTWSTALLPVYILSKIMANPAAASSYANMLRAGTLAEQDFWAHAALSQVMPKNSLPPQQQTPQQAPPVPSGATMGDQLKFKGQGIPIAQPNTPGLPYHPGAGLR